MTDIRREVASLNHRVRKMKSRPALSVPAALPPVLLKRGEERKGSLVGLISPRFAARGKVDPEMVKWVLTMMHTERIWMNAVLSLRL
jgi:hypothetical protein